MTKKKKSKEKELKPVDFRTFVLQDLTKMKRVQNMLLIIIQDLHIFIQEISNPESREWHKLAMQVDEILEEEKTADVLQIQESHMNQMKDKAIRTMVIFELMRQYTNFLKKQPK